MDLGPLPKYDKQDTLEQKSILALRNILPPDEYLFRDERIDDKGVDGVLELKVNGAFTNCRAQLQVKSANVGQSELNTNGSYSLSVATANLNYLLNGTSPIYVIWLAQLNELRFEWARDAWGILDAECPGWRQQKTFTVHFKKVLDQDGLAEIRKRVLSESIMQRQIHEKLIHAAPSETVVVSISSEGLKTTDSEDAFQMIVANGITIVSSGFALRVLELLQLLPPKKMNNPRVRLVAAYASTSLGRYQEAKGHLAFASISSNGERLSDDDAIFVEQLRAAIEYSLGRLDSRQYVQQLQQFESRLPNHQLIENKLRILRHRILAEDDAELQSSLLEEMERLVYELVDDDENQLPQKINAKLVLLDAQADQLTMHFIEDVGRSHVGIVMSGSLQSACKAYRQIEERARDWMQRLEREFEAARESRNPVLISHAMFIVVKCHVSMYVNAVAMSGELNSKRVSDLEWLVNYTKECIELFHRSGNLRMECKSKMLLADFYEATGERQLARDMAQEVLPIARAFEYPQEERSAKDHLENQSLLMQLQRRITERPSDDEIALSQTDDDIRDMALHVLESANLPAERLPLVEKDFRAGKFIAFQRREWCRYIELEQDLSHLQSSDTTYQSDPDRFGYCTKLGHRSIIGHPDFEYIIDLFKKNYCEVCSVREPGGSLIVNE